MPTYVYFCNECGELEIVSKITDKPLTTCPECGSIDFKKKFSAVGVHFKGNGFYSTDGKKT